MKTKRRLLTVLILILVVALGLALGRNQLYYLYRDISYYFGERSRAERIVKAFATENNIRYGRYPVDLIELLDINPETEDFVLNYPLWLETEIDLSGYSRDTVPLFLQWDPMWGYETYGSGCIGQTGRNASIQTPLLNFPRKTATMLPATAPAGPSSARVRESWG